MSLGNGNPKDGDKGSNFNYELKVLQGLEAIAVGLEAGIVQDITVTAPLASTGGSTPNLSIPKATTGIDGYLSSTDWNTFNNKQATLVSGTNIKTINGNSLLGSGNLSISGASGLIGVHNINGFVPSAGNFGIDANMTGASPAGSHLSVANQLLLYPFIPNKALTIGSIAVYVGNSTAGVLSRILIYSDSGGLPNSKLYESVDIDCSINGFKTVNTTFTFNAGTTYWLAYHTNGGGSLTTGISQNSLLPLYMIGFTQGAFTMLTASITFGSAPSTFSYTGNQATGVVPRIMLFKFPF